MFNFIFAGLQCRGGVFRRHTPRRFGQRPARFRAIISRQRGHIFNEIPHQERAAELVQWGRFMIPDTRYQIEQSDHDRTIRSWSNNHIMIEQTYPWSSNQIHDRPIRYKIDQSDTWSTNHRPIRYMIDQSDPWSTNQIHNRPIRYMIDQSDTRSTNQIHDRPLRSLQLIQLCLIPRLRILRAMNWFAVC